MLASSIFFILQIIETLVRTNYEHAGREVGHFIEKKPFLYYTHYIFITVFCKKYTRKSPNTSAKFNAA